MRIRYRKNSDTGSSIMHQDSHQRIKSVPDPHPHQTNISIRQRCGILTIFNGSTTMVSGSISGSSSGLHHSDADPQQCLMIEGSGAGSVPHTNGSGSACLVFANFRYFLAIFWVPSLARYPNSFLKTSKVFGFAHGIAKCELYSKK